MRERDIEQYLRTKVQAAGGWAPKWVSPGNNGVPDRIVFFPGLAAVFIELKAQGKKPDKLQLAQHRRLHNLGQVVRVIDSKEQVDRFIEEMTT